MSPGKKKSAATKAASKKTVSKKTVSKKTVSKKTVSRTTAKGKTAVKKAAVKKATVKKTTVKNSAASKPALDHDEIVRIGAKNLQAVASDIDRQMKMLAEIDSRVLIAKDQLADLQEVIHSKINAFQEKKSARQAGSHKDLMTSIRETRDEASKIIRDSKALHDTYESAVKYFEKGRVAAMKEAKKAEIVLVKKLHEVEAKMLKKAGEIKKNMKNNH